MSDSQNSTLCTMYAYKHPVSIQRTLTWTTGYVYMSDSQNSTLCAMYAYKHPVSIQRTLCVEPDILKLLTLVVVFLGDQLREICGTLLGMQIFFMEVSEIFQTLNPH